MVSLRFAMMNTSPEDCKIALDSLKASFVQGKSKPLEFRIRNLLAIKRLLKENESAITMALAKDLGRSSFEAVGLEVVPTIMEIDHVVKNLKSWTKPKLTPIPALMAPATSEIQYEPYGVCLIISAFNYPVSLTLGPLIGAIMAGNCAVIKPSEMAVECEALMSKLLSQYLDADCYRVICGGVATTSALLALAWDKIFFTGSTRVGKIVMAAAAKNLTPVSLELGGKSPTIIDESVTDLDLATKRIMWGKFANCGQTCIAPDYILCHAKHYDAFLTKAKAMIEQFYGANPQDSPDFGRIISEAHCDRLKALLDDKPGNVLCGGQVDRATRFVAPTIITDVRLDSLVMSDEIFGPLLPVIKIASVDEAISIIRTMEKPLSLYIFSKNRKMIDRVIAQIPSGGVLVNDTLFHFANSFIPFGGVGPSGLGGYHGQYSLECFSHRRSVMRRDDHAILDVPIRYPPYTKHGLAIFKKAAALPALPAISKNAFVWSALTALGAAAAGIAYWIVKSQQ